MAESVNDVGYGQSPDLQNAGTSMDEQDQSEVWDDPLANEEDLQKELYKLLLRCVAEDRYSRIVEVKDVKQAHLYWRGLQYIWWSERSQNWSLPSMAQALNYSDLAIDDQPRFEYVTNIYQSRGLAVASTLASTPIPVRFFPEDAENIDDLETADSWDKLIKLITRWNPIKKLLVQEAYHMWCGGVIAAFVRFEKDAEKFGEEEGTGLAAGVDQEPDQLVCPQCGFQAPADVSDFSQGPVPCPGCGAPLDEENVAPGQSTQVPVDTGSTLNPKGKELITIVGALNLKRPQWAPEQSDFHYLVYETEEHYAKLRKRHPHVAERIKPGANLGSDDAFERNARLSVAEGTRLLTQTGSAQAVLVTLARAWFRPDAFWMLEKDVRDRLLALFPRGVRVDFAGDIYCRSHAESMDDHWVITHALPGDGQHRPAIGTSMMSVQDRFNNLSNIEMETYEYGLPITYRAADTFDDEANEDQKSEPGSEVPVNLKPNEDIRGRIMQVRADSVSEDLYHHAMDLMGPVSDQMSGAQPALWGATEPGATNETASGFAMQRDQAMGRMGLFYSALKQFHADVATIACADYCRENPGEVRWTETTAGDEFETTVVDTAALEGDAKAYPEGDENFPEMATQKKMTFTSIMQSPFAPDILKEPDNLDLGKKLLGMPELVVPGSDLRRKAMKIIGMLTKVQPGEQMSAPIPPEGLVDPEIEDAEGFESAAAKKWLNSHAGLKCKMQNPVGWQNVKAYHLALKALIPPPPPPPEDKVKTSVSVAFKDMPPDVQAQFLQHHGIQMSPEDFVAAAEKFKQPPAQPGAAGGAPKPPAGKGK